MTDVLIAGGGIAGSSLAILLGQRGITVELYERGQFPREKPCGEGLMPGGVAVLQRLGLATAVGGFPFQGVRYHFGAATAEGAFPQVTGFPRTGRGQRRRVLDQVLFHAAASTPGVTAWTGRRVDGPLVERGRVAGLWVDGEPRNAPLVVAADGVHSRIRHLLGLNVPVRRKRFGIRAHFRLAPGQRQPPWVEVFLHPGYEIYVTPLPGNEVMVALLADAGPMRELPEQTFHRRWRVAPPLASRLEGAEQLAPLLGSSPLAGRARSGIAPGVILLGDAAGFLDPITGGGMTQALQTAELLANHIAARQGRGDEWLWEFERQRRSLLRDYRLLAQAVLWLAGHPWMAGRALSALRIFPGLFSHFIGVSGGVRSLLGFPALRPAFLANRGSSAHASATQTVGRP